MNKCIVCHLEVATHDPEKVVKGNAVYHGKCYRNPKPAVLNCKLRQSYFRWNRWQRNITVMVIALCFALHAEDKTCKFAEVHWADATLHSSRGEDFDTTKLEILLTPQVSFGCIVEGENVIVIIHNFVGANPLPTEYTAIPKSWATKVVYMEEKNEKTDSSPRLSKPNPLLTALPLNPKR